jgi:hypothetical protein
MAHGDIEPKAGERVLCRQVPRSTTDEFVVPARVEQLNRDYCHEHMESLPSLSQVRQRVQVE